MFSPLGYNILEGVNTLIDLIIKIGGVSVSEKKGESKIDSKTIKNISEEIAEVKRGISRLLLVTGVGGAGGKRFFRLVSRYN